MTRVARAHVVRAIESRDWDLLDQLLEQDPKHAKDRSLFTDTWGEWWGGLVECVRKGHTDGVRVMLKHGAKPTDSNWGDCCVESAIDIARERLPGGHPIRELLERRMPATYSRHGDRALPELSERDRLMERQAEVAAATGLQFQVDAFETKGEEEG